VPLNVPNALTVGRVLLIPVLVVALLADTRTGDLIGAGTFALCTATDMLDGYLARSGDDITTFGKLADPLADKLLVLAALVLLVATDTLPAWVCAVIVAREVLVTVMRMGASRRGIIAPAQPLGKLKTTCQVVMVLALLLVVGSPVWLDLVVYGTVAITVISGGDFLLGLRRRSAARAPHPAT
jgi:CDP-diacylglycerol---glycerol-3-phosphate 3-phosphatidyltransferase